MPRLRLVGISLVISVLMTGVCRQASADSTPVSSLTWEQWRHVPGILDLGGPRRDGSVVVAALGQLALVSPSGSVTDFAPRYSVPDGPESYLAVSPGLAVKSANCRFGRDVVLALDLRASPPGITRISATGVVTPLATVSGASGLGGIALDTVGDFGHRLLVTGPSGGGQTQVWAIDCRGTVTSIGTIPVALEGGIAVAPRGFGHYGGQLVAPNEGDGSVYAVSETGQLSKVAESGVPAGGDIGVESVGFVPAARVTAYLADRGTPVSGQPHPGTDSLLRLNATALTSVGVRKGDLLVATEGAADLVRIRCSSQCRRRHHRDWPPSCAWRRTPASRSTSLNITLATRVSDAWAAGHGASAELNTRSLTRTSPLRVGRHPAGPRERSNALGLVRSEPPTDWAKNTLRTCADSPAVADVQATMGDFVG